MKLKGLGLTELFYLISLGLFIVCYLIGTYWKGHETFFSGCLLFLLILLFISMLLMLKKDLKWKDPTLATGVGILFLGLLTMPLDPNIGSLIASLGGTIIWEESSKTSKKTNSVFDCNDIKKLAEKCCECLKFDSQRNSKIEE